MTDAGAWRGTVAACLVGAERAAPVALPPGLDGVARDGPAGLLASAALLGVWRMAGAAPDPAGSVPLDPVAETLPECGPAAAARLESLLAEDRRHPAALRGEWCRLAAAAGLRAPDGLAPALLRASRGVPWAGAADAVLGARGPWLRGLMAAADAEVSDLPARVAALRARRRNGPDAARNALAAGWDDDPADARAALLAALETGLAMADEPFLEACLDDRAGSVRAAAAGLLQRLPGSRYAARMRARARVAVRLQRSGFAVLRLKSPDLAVVLPEPDAALRRDGLEAKPKSAGQGAALLAQLAAAAPLDSWGDAAPSAWVAAALAGDWAGSLLPGWAQAAARERAMPWLRALLDALVAPLPKAHQAFPVASTIETLARALPVPALEGFVTSALQGADMAPFLLGFCTHAWSSPFTAAVAAWTARQLGPGGPFHGAEGRKYGLNLDPIALHGDPTSAAPLAALAAAHGDAVAPAVRRALDEAAETLRFRAGMQQELTA